MHEARLRLFQIEGPALQNKTNKQNKTIEPSAGLDAFEVKYVN